MKRITFSFMAVFIFSVNAVFAPLPIDAQKNENADWAALFPEIPGCERIIQPITQNGKVFEQTAVYERQNYKEYKGNNNYFGCGSIALRFAPSARKSARINYVNSIQNPIYFPPPQKQTVKSFDAYSNSPLCGNDIWVGSTSVYFDEDKVLMVSAYMGAGNILEFAKNADYELLRKSIDKFVKSKS
jgi:hypothetical protein